MNDGSWWSPLVSVKVAHGCSGGRGGWVRLGRLVRSVSKTLPRSLSVSEHVWAWGRRVPRVRDPNAPAGFCRLFLLAVTCPVPSRALGAVPLLLFPRVSSPVTAFFPLGWFIPLYPLWAYRLLMTSLFGFFIFFYCSSRCAFVVV